MPVEEEYNCVVYAKNWSWTLQNPTSNESKIKIYDVPTDLDNDEYLVLDYIDIYCARMVNPNTSIRMPAGYTISRGYITSNADMKMTVKIGNVKSNETYTIRSKKITLQPSGSNIANTATWANVDADDTYRFTFPDKVIIHNKEVLCNLSISGMGTNNRNGITFRRQYNGSGISRIFGRAHISKMQDYPTSIDTDVSGVWITNLTGKTKNGSTIFADSSETLKLVTSGGDEIANARFTGNNNTTCRLSGNTITVKASNRTANYPTADNIRLSVKGGNSNTVSCNFSVRFYKKPSVDFSTERLIVNIKNASNYNFVVSKYDMAGVPTDKTYSALRYTVGGSTTSWDTLSSRAPIPNSNNRINVSKYLGIASNGSNYFKIANEGKEHNVTFRYFNPNVQAASVNNNYNSDVSCKFTFYAKPKELAQFSFDWLSGSDVTTEPSIMLPGIVGSPIPGNLSYTNASVTGGYCRAIKLSFYRSNGTLLYSEVRRTTDQADGSSLLSGRIIYRNDALWAKLRDLLGSDYVTEMLTVKADLAFHFSDDTNSLYYGCSYTWKPKLWLVTEEDLKIDRLFPIVNKVAPATPMMLTDVERFGYILTTATVNNADLLNIDFGVTIGDYSITQRKQSNYFSSNIAVNNIVVDVGKFVADNNVYLAQCKVIPYMTVFTGEEYEQKISFTNDWVKPNAIINTLESTMWYRPVVEKGEYATYFDVERFQQFIDKYTPLNNNQKFSPMIKEKRGDIINVEFWRNIEEKLDAYSKAMQDWVANQATNMVVIWAFPEFQHQRGEYITNNNLYQNYWDLLHMFSGYNSFATHDYLKDSGYTHDYLSNFTHDDITNKRGI